MNVCVCAHRLLCYDIGAKQSHTTCLASCLLMPTNACVGDVATRLSSLSLNDDAERAIVQGLGTIRADEMPFVNRHEELWQVFRVNADNIRQIKLSMNPIKDFRPYSCYSVFR